MNLIDARLGRFELFSGVQVGWGSEDSAVGEVLERIGDSDDGQGRLWRYRVRSCGIEYVKEESELIPLPVNRTDPLSMLRGNVWHSLKSFRRRQSFLRMLEVWSLQTAGIPSLMGVRIDPMGHQLYAMRRVLASSRPRFVLADEVGLGKTIEAGLVMQALLQEEPGLRILVIAPGSMSRQWFSEMYLRFGARAFGLLEAEDLHRRGSEAQEYARTRLVSGRVIVSTTALMAAPKLRSWVEEADWDLVVLDEAHRFAIGHPLFPTLARLSAHSNGFLALSATPSSKELTGLSCLLGLVAPEAYTPGDVKTIEDRISAQKGVWRALSDSIAYLEAANREGAELDQQDFEFLYSVWQKATITDPTISELCAKLRGGSRQAIEEMIAYVQEFHRIDQRLIRTRRSTLVAQGRQWPDRRLIALEYEPSNSETDLINHLAELDIPGDPKSRTAGLRLLYERICGICPGHATTFLEFRRRHLESGPNETTDDPFDRLLQDPEPGYELVLQSSILRSVAALPGETGWIATALSLANEWSRRDGNAPARFRAAAKWIRSHISEHSENKVLVFCQEADIVAKFSSFLKTMLGDAVETFHYQMTEDELSRVALRFQRVPECRVLVSDELGGEGRNFQVATTVLHLDIPWSVSRIEQRIGRLDRIARPPERDVLSVVMIGPGELERSLFAVHRKIFRVYERSIGGLEFGLPATQRRLTDAMRRGPTGIREIQDELQSLVVAEIERTDEAFDFALDSSKRQLLEGSAVAKGLKEAQATGGGSDTLCAWAERIGFKVKHQSGNRVEVTVDPEWYRGTSERLPYSGRTLISGTFKHSVAMANDSLQFFGPGHPLIDFLVREFETESDGRAAAAKIAVRPQYQGRIFAFVTVRYGPNLEVLGHRGLSPALRLRVTEYFPSRRVSVPFELAPYESVTVRQIEEEEREFVSKLRTSERADRISAAELNAIAPLGQIWKAAELAATEALQRTREAHASLRSEAAARLAESLKLDIQYLRWRADNGDPHAATDASSLAKVDEAITTEMLTIDSILLVAGVQGQ